MASFNLPNVDGMTSIEEIKNAVGKMVKELTWLLQNLDTRNVNELHAEVIVAGSVTADKITVNELSALSANMGKLTSGEIYGGYIATSETAYPRVVLDPNTDVLTAYYDADNYVTMAANFGNKPAFTLVSPFNTTSVTTDSESATFQTEKDLYFGSGSGDIYIDVGMGNAMRFDDFTQLFDVFSGKSLETRLSELSARISAVETGIS